MKQSWMLFASFCCLIPVASFADSSFMGGEHVFIGNQVALQVASTVPAQPVLPLHLSNGAELTYGEILAMGDFYGISNVPISEGSTPAERDQRFMNVFAQLDALPASAPESTALVKVMHQELEYVQGQVSNGVPAHQAYNAIIGETDRQYNCITGGGCGKKTWWMHSGRLLTLALTNFDHFGQNAWLAYEAGHRVAMDEAAKAKQTGDLAHLYRAYAMNAFASHFLADRFAAGHIRTPRIEIVKKVTPAVVGDLLMKYMHDEENAGISVHDASANHWRAVGDGYYFEQGTNEHHQRLLNALQTSADEVYAAYESGRSITSSAVINMLPNPDETDSICANDIAQLFRWDERNQTLLRRADLSNQHDCRWTSHWFGWTTLIALYRLDGVNTLSIADQASLANSDMAQSAIEAGLIQNEEVIDYIKTRKAI